MKMISAPDVLNSIGCGGENDDSHDSKLLQRTIKLRCC